MSRWSSFERDKRHADAWRKYICEGRKIEVELEEGVLDSVKGAIDTVKVKATDATRSAKSAAGYEVDSVGPDPGAKAGEAEPDAEFAGISSEVYPDSLNNMLKPRVSDGTITDEQKKQIVLKMVALTREEGIVLEALGDDPNPRSYSSKATGELSQLIDSFGLEPEAIKKLNQTINKWAKMNTVKFEKPAATGRPIDSDAAGADAESDEEPGVVKQTIEKVKAAANSEAGRAIEGILDGLSLIPGANIPASIGSAVLNLAQGEPKEAAMSLLSLIPVAGAAGKLGKFGPLAAKLAPAIKTASKAKAVQSGKETLQIALDKVGIDADVEEIQKATKTAVAMYDKLADIPGVGEELSKTMGSYVEPLRSVVDAGTAEDSGESDLEWTPPEEWGNLTNAEEEWLDSLNLDDGGFEELAPTDISAVDDAEDAPGSAPPGYRSDEFGTIFISMVRPDTDVDEFSDGTWALYRNIDSDNEVEFFAWSPTANNGAPASRSVPSGPFLKRLTNLPIMEEQLIFERWQTLAGINKRVL